MATNNSINLKEQGTAYYNGAGTFSGVDASTAGFILTSNGTGIAPSFQAASSGGTFVKQVRALTNTTSSPSTVIPIDGTIPQIGEGTQLFSLAITPANSANILVFQCTIQTAVDAFGMVCAMFQDSTANCLAAITAGLQADATSGVSSVVLTYSMTAGTTSSTTFQIRVGPGSAGNAYINRTSVSANPLGAGSIYSNFTISEYSA